MIRSADADPLDIEVGHTQLGNELAKRDGTPVLGELSESANRDDARIFQLKVFPRVIVCRRASHVGSDPADAARELDRGGTSNGAQALPDHHGRAVLLVNVDLVNERLV